MSNELESRFEKINLQADRDKATIEYVYNLIEQNQDKFNEVFTDSEGETPNNVELYDKVELIIKTMQMEALRTSGIVVTYLKLNDERQYLEPTVKLGWRKYLPAFHSLGDEDVDPDKQYPNILRLTEAGEEVVDGWRAVQGYVSLRQQESINFDREEARRNSTY